MLVIIGLTAGFASIIILTAGFNFLKSNNKKKLCVLLWIASLLVSGISLAVYASKTYIPSTYRLVGHWVSVATGKRVSAIYDVAKEGSGTSPLTMFFLVVLVFFVYSLISTGSVATGKNMARHAAKIPRKILSFLTWFTVCFCSGMITAGIIPVILAKKSSTASGISRNMKIAIILSLFVLMLFISRRLMPLYLACP